MKKKRDLGRKGYKVIKTRYGDNMKGKGQEVEKTRVGEAMQLK